MKRISAFILALIMIASLVALCSCSNATLDPTETESPTEEGAVTTLAGKTPKELYDYTKTALTAENYTINVKMTESVNFSDEPIAQVMEYVYAVNGNNAYTSYTVDGGSREDRCYVDGTAYISAGANKNKGVYDKDTFKATYILKPVAMFLPLDEEIFADAKFVNNDGIYELELFISPDKYLEMASETIARDAVYKLYFDAEGQFKSFELSVVYAASNGVTIDFDRVYTYTPSSDVISAPADADSYRTAPNMEDIDMTAIDSLDGVSESETPTDYVLIDVAEHGKMLVRLYPDVAPDTVANFKSLVSEKYYDGLVFHRVIKDFMIQGGDGAAAKNIEGEFAANDFLNNLLHQRGVISMARAQSANSASSQFFIVHKTSPHLDGQYAAFGFVVYGLDVIDSVAAVTTDEGDHPVTDVVINSIRFVTVAQ